MNLKRQTSEPVVTTIINCSPVIANNYRVFLGAWQAFSQLIFTWMRVVWEKWSFQGLCTLPQITLIILPNFQQNCRNLASVLLGVLSFDQFLAFNWFIISYYNIAFPVPLSTQRTFCNWYKLLDIDTNHLPAFKIR